MYNIKDLAGIYNLEILSNCQIQMTDTLSQKKQLFKNIHRCKF
jgi:hypothetical protein